MELIKERFGLNEFEYICLTLAYKGEIDSTVTPSVWQAMEIYAGKEKEDKQEKNNAFLSLMPEKPLSYLLEFQQGGHFRLREEVFRFILNDLQFLQLQDTEVPCLVLYTTEKQQILNFLNSCQQQSRLIIINAPENSGKKTLAKQICRDLGKGAFVVSTKTNDKQEYHELVTRAVCICIMTDSIPIVTSPALIEYFPDFVKTIFLCDVSDSVNYDGLHITLPPLNLSKRKALWEYFGINFELAEQYRLLPGQIAKIARSVKNQNMAGFDCGDNRLIAKEVGRMNKKGSVIRLVHPAFKMGDLILEERAKSLLELIKNTMLIRVKLYDEYGYGKLFPYGRGIGVMFHGASGTGKTMAVQSLAAELGLDVMVADISRIIDKYIGETEKHLSEIFEKANQSNCVLFFDEADSLFAKRTEVSDSHDRSANSQTAHLLQKIEEYDGLVILATNLIDNVDDAFKRRLPFIVEFKPPDAALRKIMWKKFIPAEMPTEDLDFGYLSNEFELTPAIIKWAAFSAAVRAAENRKIKMEHILDALRYEYEKTGAAFPELPEKEIIF